MQFYASLIDVLIVLYKRRKSETVRTS